jgi:H+/gluconate symporter-like permease
MNTPTPDVPVVAEPISSKVYSFAVGHPNLLLGLVIVLICYIVYTKYLEWKNEKPTQKTIKKKEKVSEDTDDKVDEQTDKLIAAIEEKQKTS